MWEIVAGWHGFWQFVFLVILMTAGFRAVAVVTRGWPPPHLDADGDSIK